MKKVYVLLFLLLAGSMAFVKGQGQLDANKVYVGLHSNLLMPWFRLNGPNETPKYDIYGRVGIQFARGFIAGLDLGYSDITLTAPRPTNNVPNSFFATANRGHWLLGGFGRYNYGLNDKWGIFVDASYRFGLGSLSNDFQPTAPSNLVAPIGNNVANTNTAQLRIGPGVSYFFGKIWSADLSIPVRWNYYDNGGGPSGYSLLGINVGISAYLDSLGSNGGSASKARDRDKDGVPDDQDGCPKIKGSASANGCPDADGDGVADADDKCPSVAGKKSANGCPDADGDGLTDAEDKCPTASGTAAFAGCPDTDGDGIVDAEDQCPTVKGPADKKGCPDTDGDGILDKDDTCPNQAGVASARGCPDGDGDGIADAQDKCPAQRGVASAAGCPDRDADGIADSEDKCPDVAGTAAYQGCAGVQEGEKKAVEEKLSMVAKKIQFETGSANIRQVSLKEIEEVVAIMNQYPATRFQIEGHTDNVGNAELNRKLSQQRADAVKTFIVSKGIASDRLNATGFGPDRPISNNATPQGRLENRRVEIHLSE